MIGQPCKHVSEPGARIDIIELAGLNQRKDRFGATTAFVGAGEGPVAAADGNVALIVPLIFKYLETLEFGFPIPRDTGDPFG